MFEETSFPRVRVDSTTGSRTYVPAVTSGRAVTGESEDGYFEETEDVPTRVTSRRNSTGPTAVNGIFDWGWLETGRLVRIYRGVMRYPGRSMTSCRTGAVWLIADHDGQRRISLRPTVTVCSSGAAGRPTKSLALLDGHKGKAGLRSVCLQDGNKGRYPTAPMFLQCRSRTKRVPV